jgi:hypothetical protein
VDELKSVKERRAELEAARIAAIEAVTAERAAPDAEYLRQCQERFDNQQRREREARDRDMLELIDMIRSELAEASLAAVAPVPEPEAPLLPAPDALMADYGPVGEGFDDITGDMLLDAFEQDETETAAIVQTLSATRLRHLSEQLNVEKARLRREHMLTDQANPREASIDRLLGLLTRRGEV